ncbi:MAG: hemolysin III family protein [Nevskiaceae bacterium]|nr:MAG: hemolysin III family protein [Nevskiaceae bacterium]TBR71349.1 MAG: hemolysin III family protein [Nevskiaceae bacterium]
MNPVLAAEPENESYTFGEELAHALTHGLGAVLSIAGLTVLVARAALYGDTWHVVSAAIFGASLVAMYTASALFHSIPLARPKHVLRIVDHCLIYVLIAGTYTPFTLVTLHGAWGWSLFGFTWGLAAVGAVFKIFFTGRFEALSLAVYLLMGWCCVVAIVPLWHALPAGGLAWLVAGGVCYTVGVAFYALGRLRYHHAIWHVFVLAGSICHYFGILLYVIPGAA